MDLPKGKSIWTQQAVDHVNDTLKELANAGMTVCVSTGDDGSDDQVADGQAHVSFPASSPYVLAVGGTALDRTTGDEIVWFEGDGVRRDQGGSTGGGVSEFNPKPSWQTVNIPSVDPSVKSGRIIPDVAADAAGSTGYFMVAQEYAGDRRRHERGHPAVGWPALPHRASGQERRLLDAQALYGEFDHRRQNLGHRRLPRHHLRQQQIGRLGRGLLGHGRVRRLHRLGQPQRQGPARTPFMIVPGAMVLRELLHLEDRRLRCEAAARPVRLSCIVFIHFVIPALHPATAPARADGGHSRPRAGSQCRRRRSSVTWR